MSGAWEWFDGDAIYLTVGVGGSTLGWPPTGPVKVQQVSEGSVQPVKSISDAEPPIETLPAPPPVTIDVVPSASAR